MTEKRKSTSARSSNAKATSGSAKKSDADLDENEIPADDGEDRARDEDDRGKDLLGLGAFIRSQRRLAELSQRELAKLTQLSDPYVSQLERGLHEPSMRVLRNLATALNLPMETLIRQAGWLEESEDLEATSTEAAIRHDEGLTADQKSALLVVYRALRASEK